MATFDLDKLFSLKKPIQQAAQPDVNFVYEHGNDLIRHTDFNVAMTMPFEFYRPDGVWWLLPLEPMVSISGSNIIAKRSVAKRASSQRRGTIKERWNEDDLSITIEGVFINPDLNLAFSEREIKWLYEICQSGQAIEARCAAFEFYSINRIVIESFDFPFTKGKENQAYSIKALSDDAWELFVKLDKKNYELGIKL